MTKYEKMRTATVSFLKGRNYYDVLENFAYAEQAHSGLRKDGVTPEFYHHLCMLNYARNLKISVEERKLFNTILGHDLFEDYNVLLPKSPQNESILSKNGKNTSFYYENLSFDVYTSLVKGIDRVDNLSTMVNVFSLEKQQRYITETREFVLPMLNKAKNFYPAEENAFRMIKHSILLMVDMWEGIRNEK